MPDHLHLIALGNSDDTDLLGAVEEFKQRTGYWLHKHHPAIRWQKSFYDRIIRENELVTHVNYVLDNPIRWGLVDDWRKYRFIGAIGLDLQDFLNSM